MATYTSNYAWTKPEGSDPVDIGVLNNNLDSQDSIVHNAYMQLAPVFSTASTYAVDDVVLYSDNLYKCHTAVTVAGDWDATKWTQVKVTDIVGGGGGGGGHTIENASGTAMTQRDALQFKGGLSVSDDSINERTVVSGDYELITWADWQTIVENHEESLHPDAIITDVPGADGDVSVELMTKLWENTSPTADFAAQDITGLTTLADVQFLLVIAKTTASGSTYLQFLIKNENITSLLQYSLPSTAAAGTSSRYRTILPVSASNKITFGDGRIGATGTADSVSNSVLIPYQIYGIKTTASVKVSAIAESVSTSADKCMLADGASVEDRVTANTISSENVVSLTYNTEYTTLSDGYFRINCNAGSDTWATGKVNDITVIQCTSVPTQSANGFASIFVRKGSKIKFSGKNSTDAAGKFYPLS